MIKQLWMRLGDVGDYEKVDDPYSAGYQVGSFLGENRDLRDMGLEPTISWQPLGVSVDPGFTGHKYISLFWGDEDAQPVGKPELTTSERAEFKRGLWEGADIKVAPKKPKAKSKPKPRRKPAGVPPTSMRGLMI